MVLCEALSTHLAGLGVRLAGLPLLLSGAALAVVEAEVHTAQLAALSVLSPSDVVSWQQLEGLV